jgi:uncharacterized protein
VIALAWSAAGVGAPGCSPAGPALGGAAQDPVTQDPPLDPAHPAALVATAIASGGSRLNGVTYVAQGRGPHPVAVLLHGHPGDERNLDLAHAMRRAGWTVLFFHYRGAWGSEGAYSLAHGLEDVAAAVKLASSPAFAAAHRADPGRIALVGHSMGGFFALVAGSELPDVTCVASIAGANVGRIAPADPETAAGLAQRLDAMNGPLRGTTGRALVAEIAAHAERFDTTRRAGALAARPVLLVAGLRDAVLDPEVHHDPLVRALQEADAADLRIAVMDADHAFSSHRIALARTLVSWLETECR